MPQFSERSKQHLASAHPDLQHLFETVIKMYDCAIIIGHRGEADQNEAFEQGHSKEQWPNSKHNKQPSLAVDALPSPIDWGDKIRMYHFAGFVLAIAEMLGIKIRWGGDWNRNLNFKDQRFQDLVHFEIVEPGHPTDHATGT